MPPGASQFSCYSGIPPNVFPNLLSPKSDIGGWLGGLLAIVVAVPKAAVDQKYGFMLWKNDVRFARQSFEIPVESQALFMQEPCDRNLGLGSLRQN